MGAVVEAGKLLNFDDLKQDGTVMFQKRYDPWFTLFMCFVFPALVAKYCWGEAFWPALHVTGSLRYCVVLHFTWLVNSAAHFFGDHPYDFNSWPAENPFVSLGAIGEGWHNWHHKYPFDCAASEFGVGRQFNPTKLFIDGCAMVGLVTKRKRATGAWAKLKEKRIEALKKEPKDAKSVTGPYNPKWASNNKPDGPWVCHQQAAYDLSMAKYEEMNAESSKATAESKKAN